MIKIDLHGMTWRQAREEFIKVFNETARNASGATPTWMEVIHGYGSSGEGGVIRHRLRRYLSQHEPFLRFITGESQDGNEGHTFITPLKSLPIGDEELEELILDYCERPRTIDKITGQFHRHGFPAVKASVSALERSGALKSAIRGRVRLFEVA